MPFKECRFTSQSKPAHTPVILSELAWMGSTGGATHEWIELKNLSGKGVNMPGWQLINENEKLHITFPQQSVLKEQFTILARKAANEALNLNAPITFTGSIRNSGEGLRLFDNNCRLIDEVLAPSRWPAGDNKTKQTMERESDLSWKTSIKVGGTPGF